MRRKPGTLLPLEISILEAAVDLRTRGDDEFHGFAVAKEIKEREDSRTLTAHGTLYKALERMERAGLLESRWEDPEVAAAESRPTRARARGIMSSIDLAVGLTRAWVRVYTRGLPAEERTARRAELDADLWEHAHDAGNESRRQVRIALEVVERLVAGMPADISWRRE